MCVCFSVCMCHCVSDTGCERERDIFVLFKYDAYYKFILSIYRVRASDSVFVCVSEFVYYGAYCTH